MLYLDLEHVMHTRHAQITDATGIARVQVDTWRSTYRGIVPDGYLDSMAYEHQERYWLERLGSVEGDFALVVESDEKHILGFSYAGRNMDLRREFAGELHKLYLLKDSHGMGIGSRLLRATANALLERRMNSMIVWVLGDNPFRGFYESMSGKKIAERTINIGGKPLLDVAYGWSDLHVIS